MLDELLIQTAQGTLQTFNLERTISMQAIHEPEAHTVSMWIVELLSLQQRDVVDEPQVNHEEAVTATSDSHSLRKTKHAVKTMDLLPLRTQVLQVHSKHIDSSYEIRLSEQIRHECLVDFPTEPIRSLQPIPHDQMHVPLLHTHLVSTLPRDVDDEVEVVHVVKHR